VGNTASLKSIKIAGPVVVAVGGLLLLFITIWSSRQGKLDDNTSCEEATIYANRTASNDGSNTDQLGPIHRFEVKKPLESSWKEMAPPSYEEAIDNNNDVGNSLTSTEVVPRDDKEASLDKSTSAPPSYEEKNEKAETAS